MPCQGTGYGKCSMHKPTNQIRCRRERGRNKGTGKKKEIEREEKRRKKTKIYDERKNTRSMREITRYERRKEMNPEKTKLGEAKQNQAAQKTETETESKADHKREPMQQPTWIPNATEYLATWSCHLQTTIKWHEEEAEKIRQLPHPPWVACKGTGRGGRAAVGKPWLKNPPRRRQAG